MVYGTETAFHRNGSIEMRYLGTTWWRQHLGIWERKGWEAAQKMRNEDFQMFYSSITSTKTPSFYTTTFSASLTNLTALLPQSRDTSCYVSRPILAPPPLWVQKHTDLRAHDFAHSSDLWHQPRLANGTCAWRWRLYGINPAIVFATYS